VRFGLGGAALRALRLLGHEHVSDCYLSKEVAEIGGLGELRPFVVPRRLFAISFRLAQLVLHRHPHGSTFEGLATKFGDPMAPRLIKFGRI
jgi:hypothetical protein